MYNNVLKSNFWQRNGTQTPSLTKCLNLAILLDDAHDLILADQNPAFLHNQNQADQIDGVGRNAHDAQVFQHEVQQIGQVDGHQIGQTDQIGGEPGQADAVAEGQSRHQEVVENAEKAVRDV